MRMTSAAHHGWQQSSQLWCIMGGDHCDRSTQGRDRSRPLPPFGSWRGRRQETGHQPQRSWVWLLQCEQLAEAGKAVRGCRGECIPGRCSAHHQQGLFGGSRRDSLHRSATLRFRPACLHHDGSHQPGCRLTRRAPHFLSTLRCRCKCVEHPSHDLAGLEHCLCWWQMLGWVLPQRNERHHRLPVGGFTRETRFEPGLLPVLLKV